MIMTEKAFERRIQEIKDAHQALIAAMQKQIDAAAFLSKHAYLTRIERVERRVIFTFMVESKLVQIETIGTWADNIEEWKEQLNVK